MPTTTISLPQRGQPSQQTRDKAQRLDVLMLTKTMALIEGDHDTYLVWLDTLECGCKAGQAGITCSHALRAAEARPKPRRRAQYDPATGDLAVWENGLVIGHCNSYLDMEATHG